jgi:adenylate cyclase
MAKEIERKFLVKGEFRHLAGKKVNIIQAYLSTDPERIVRIRISGDKALLTIKGSHREGGFSRNEWETEIPPNMANEIIDICVPGRINKTRYYIPYGNHVFEVDEFHDKNEGLIIAEIELSDENEEFEKPYWLGTEVTGKPEYQNSNLI